MTSGQHRTTLTGHSGYVESVAFSPDGSTLASGSGDKTVRLWDVVSGQPIAILIGHTDDGGYALRSIAFSPDSTTFASCGQDRTVRLWDVASGQLIAILAGHTSDVRSVAFSPDGSTLASGSWDRTVILWDPTASATTPAVLSIAPISIKPLTIGEQVTVSLNIVGGENVLGYQATVVFDPAVLIYFSSANGDYLSGETFLAVPVVEKNYIRLESTSLIGSSDGDGTLATITFQVVDAKASELFLSQVTLVDPSGERLFPIVVGRSTITDRAVLEPIHRVEDINADGVVNIQDMVLVSANFGRTGNNKADVNGDGVVDIVDLVKVAGALRDAAAAPSFHPQTLTLFTVADVQSWLTQAQHLNLTDRASQSGVRFLEQLLAVLTPQKTLLLPNYPNPFNPETWLPYQLARPGDVHIVIYDARGHAIRQIALGHRGSGHYTTRSRAAYWDGCNDFGERVAAGVYFYQLRVGDMSAVRKMVVIK